MTEARVRRQLGWWRAATIALGLALGVLAVLASRQIRVDPPPQAEEPAEPERMTLRAASFDTLPGWRADDQTAALPALLRSCAVWTRRPAGSRISRSGLGGEVDDWLGLCADARRLDAAGAVDREAVRAVLERWLTPHQVIVGEAERGLMTGYYEPTLHGSLDRAPGFDWPLYRRPPELVEVDLGSFREELEGQRIAGQVDGGRLRPYADRAAIDGGALAGRGLELVWVDDPIDLFFLHIQGSGRVELEDGSVLRVGYAGQNGHAYYAIGRALIESGALEREAVSMQSIRAWLVEHPLDAADLLARNPSFVFFRRLAGAGPTGSLGVELTPERSIAVDRSVLPMGAPMWIDTDLPSTEAEPGAPLRPWRRLVLAQDTGGAIRGPLRADLYWGPGDAAAEIAGRMRQEGRLWLLLPSSLDAVTAASIATGE